MRILGVDPGLSGALAVVDRQGALLYCLDVPTVAVPHKGGSRQQLSPALLFDALAEMGPFSVAYVEQVTASPQMGVTSAFRFGEVYGMTLAILAARGIRVELVRPQAWKKDLALNSDAEVSRSKALELWPDQSALFKRKMDHNRAEAALIAEWGRRQQ